MPTRSGWNCLQGLPNSVSHYIPLQQLATDLAANTVAQNNRIVPDQYNDTHISPARVSPTTLWIGPLSTHNMLPNGRGGIALQDTALDLTAQSDGESVSSCAFTCSSASACRSTMASSNATMMCAALCTPVLFWSMNRSNSRLAAKRPMIKRLGDKTNPTGTDRGCLRGHDERKAQVERVVAGGEPTGALDFVDIGLGGNRETGLLSDTLDLLGCRL